MSSRIRSLWPLRLWFGERDAEAEPTASSPHPRTWFDFHADEPPPLNEDEFQRGPFVERLASALSQRRDPANLVVGVYGQWGEGKTTALGMLSAVLRSQPGIEVFDFNVWGFVSERDLLEAFLSGLAQALRRPYLTKRERIGRFLGRYGGFADLIKIECENLKIQPQVRQLGEWLAYTSEAEKRRQIEGVLEALGVRIVVLIDDFDRLDKEQMFVVLRMLHQSISFQYTTFIVALDPEAVASAIGHRFGPEGAETGRKFLQKFVQVPLSLPLIPGYAIKAFFLRQLEMCFGSLQLPSASDDILSISQLFDLGLSRLIPNLRAVRRLVNTVYFTLPLVKGEVNISDFVAMEALRLSFPSTYNYIKENRQEFCGDLRNIPAGERDSYKDHLIKCAIESTPNDAQGELTRFISFIFPYLRDGYHNGIFGEEKSEKLFRLKRISHREYVNKYFTYSVDKDDIPDASIQSLVSRAGELSGDLLLQEIRSFISGKRKRIFVSKLTVAAERASPEGAEALAIALAEVSSALRSSSYSLSRETLMSDAARLSANLTSRLTAAKQEACIKTIAEKATRVEFAVLMLDALEGSGNQSQENAIYIVRKRIITEIMESPEDTLKNVYCFRMISFVSNSDLKNEISDVLNDLLLQRPHLSLQLLVAVAPRAFTTRGSSPGDLSRDAYKSLVQVVDRHAILAALQKVTSLELNDTVFPSGNPGEENTPEIIARQFAYFVRNGSSATVTKVGTAKSPDRFSDANNKISRNIVSEIKSAIQKPLELVFDVANSRSKIVTFLDNGEIGQGRNSNEYTWRILEDRLEILEEGGDIHSRFVYVPSREEFYHTNDPDLKSLKGQIIRPASLKRQHRGE